MPENQIPATQPESGAAAGEFNFAKSEAENPRIKRRSLKAKPAGLIKPASGPPSAAREPEREAPPLASERVVKPQNISAAAAPKAAEPVPAPPKVTPSVASTLSPSPASADATTKAATTSASNTTTTSPHGTRPATLYYSSTPRKAETPSPMKTIPTASPASSSSASSATATPTSVARAATSSPRPASTVDYRANVERQSREQKSVGNILNYVVYGLIGFFVIGALLAGYGTKVIFDRLRDQSATVSDLDARYAAANKDLNAKLAATQDTLAQAQAQIGRQQDLIVKQQEELNKLIADTNDNVSALKVEKQARAQETANLRERVRDLENRPSYQKY